MCIFNCCLLTCIQISQVVLYFHVFKNVSQFVVIYTVKNFGLVNKVEVDVFLELSCFFFFIIIIFMAQIVLIIYLSIFTLLYFIILYFLLFL